MAAAIAIARRMLASDDTAKLNIRSDYSVCSSLHRHISRSEEMPAVDIDGKTKQRTQLVMPAVTKRCVSAGMSLGLRHRTLFLNTYSTKCIHKTI